MSPRTRHRDAPRPKSANGWHPMSLKTWPEARLGDLLRKHQLPPSLRSNSREDPTRPHSVFPEIRDTGWPACHLVACGEGRDGSSAIHTLLLVSADLLHPLRDPELGVVKPSRDDTERMGSYLSRVSQEAATHALRERIADVNGIAAFLGMYLRQPLNVFLDTMLASMETSVGWRPVADGDRTGWQLICEERSDRLTPPPPPLAHVHIMWPHQSGLLNQLVDDVARGVLKMHDNGSLRYVQDQAVSDHCSEVCRLGEYIISEMYTKSVEYYVVTDYDNFILFHHTAATSSNPSEKGTIRVHKRLSSEQSLYHLDTPLALLIGITLFALKKRGLEIFNRRASVVPTLSVPWMNRLSATPSPSSLSSPSRLRRGFSAHETVMPPDLGPISLTHAWEMSDGSIEHQTTTVATTLYGPYLPENDTLPTLALHDGLEWYSISSGHDGYLLMRPDAQRGEGALWSVSTAILRLIDGDDDECAVVQKISEYYVFKDVSESDWQRTQYTWQEAKAAIANEARLYAGPLAPLQGVVVPRCLGLFGRLRQDDEIWHLILEDVGRPLYLEEMVNPVVQDQVRALYRALHRAGVRHGDPRWRHVLRRGNEIRLIDFDRATVQGCLPDNEWERSCEMERQDVEAMLEQPVGQWEPET